MPDIRSVLYINGLFLIVLAFAMLIPAALSDGDWVVFVASAALTGFCGATMILGAKPQEMKELSIHQAFLLTTSLWTMTTAFAALPLTFSSLDLSYTDAYFEAMSGLTTTGSTVIVGLDRAPRSILLWRGLLNWLGGAGIIVLAVAILPLLKIGGMQLFRMESSDKTEKVKPRLRQVANGILIVYLVASVSCAILLWLAGMDWLEASTHAMATLATGGFSTSDSSLGHWSNPAIQWIVTFFMIVGGTTFVLMIAPWRDNRWPFYHDSQVRWFVGFVTFFSAILALWLWGQDRYDLLWAVTHSAFNVVSIVTTTGFVSTDYTQWGPFAQVTFFILTFIGGCSGSTSGGVKVFRWQVLFAMAGTQLKRLLQPHGVFVIDFNKQKISDNVVRSVLGFLTFYFISFAAFTLALTMTGLDSVTALSGSAQALGNVGPGLGDIIGPAGSFKPLPDSAKWILSLAMMMGRLEILTVIVLLTPAFWRR